VDIEAQSVYGPVEATQSNRGIIPRISVICLAIAIQTWTCNPIQAMVGFCICCYVLAFKPSNEKQISWVTQQVVFLVRLWRLVGFPLQAIHQYRAALPVEVWPRVLLWPLVSLMLVESHVEHAFFSIWAVLWLAVGTGGAVLPVSVAMLFGTLSFTAHSMESCSSRLRTAITFLRQIPHHTEPLLGTFILSSTCSFGLAIAALFMQNEGQLFESQELKLGFWDAQSSIWDLWMQRSHISSQFSVVPGDVRSDGYLCVSWFLSLLITELCCTSVTDTLVTLDTKSKGNLEVSLECGTAEK